MDVSNLIEDTIKKSIADYFEGKKKISVNHVLDMIFPEERRIRSLIGGLETSLGTRLWEPLALAFAAKNGFNILNHKELNKRVPIIPDEVRHFISDYENSKKGGADILGWEFYKSLCDFIKERKIVVDKYQKIPKGEGVDIWIEKSGVEYLIDIKTNQINAGLGSKLTTNQANWYTYRALEYTENKVICLLAFPFNPHNDKDFWIKEGGKVKPLISGKEAVVADEFWDFLLGKENTTQLIFDSFKRIGEQGFGKQFEHIFKMN
ncbi:TdeIII family type II restriction endonuclease [Xenorhabdus bovienii]|uniref:TdeIII family type II restriction endonuclease n=1 Tax=Xenorhabdus bovienii TaxID=40576 RepID=UPI0023B24174|nr:TdeIII family type II restriction endonuclease [Xenorhabdus bovienii]MDE9544544.1 TdeIII family type II restriction endonuclease [Xenorhabdus bovienii]MDE9550738.1 TdeIII family type II restriction endonuclease [Xenorhabdus bovienii]